MTESSHEQALKTLEKTFKDRIRRPSGENEAKSGALASVLPLHAQEVELLAREVARYSMPLAAMGGGTSPEPIAEEGKLLVRFDLMRGVRLPHGDMGWPETGWGWAPSSTAAFGKTSCRPAWCCLAASAARCRARRWGNFSLPGPPEGSWWVPGSGPARLMPTNRLLQLSRTRPIWPAR